MSTTGKPLSLDEATAPAPKEPEADVRAWQDRKIKAGLADADAGRFASPKAVRAVIQKFIPNG
jgi:predicted transcriptional regulator